MTDWFDPETWLRQIPDPLNMRGLFMDSAASWLNELARVARDRTIEVRRGETTVVGTVRSVELVPKASPGSMVSPDAGFDTLERAVVVADEVVWNGRQIDRVEVAVDDVRVSQLPRRQIRGGPVTMRLSVPLSTIAEWLGEANIVVVDEPAAGGGHDDSFTVRYRWRKLPFEAKVTPGVTARSALLTIRELRLRGRVVPLPRRFHLSVGVPVTLDDGVRLREAALVGQDTIEVEVHARSVDYPISMQQIIERLGSTAGRSVLDVSG